MPSAQAHIPTDRASRYLTQLCKHISQLTTVTHRLGHGHAEAASMPRHAEWSDTDGTIDLDWGRCTLHATDEALLLRAEADNQQHLQQIQDSITTRLGKIAHRAQLTITWHQLP
jgi:hypothetical protein